MWRNRISFDRQSHPIQTEWYHPLDGEKQCVLRSLVHRVLQSDVRSQRIPVSQVHAGENYRWLSATSVIVPYSLRLEELCRDRQYRCR